jgi:AcrR family transcriptional regulator
VPGTGGPRSEGTRRAILRAARAMFAARGYEQTTIRAVAAQADVDASMVMRYFQSKAGLFTAAVSTDLQVPDLTSAPGSRRGELLVRYFVSRWEEPAADDKLIALLRAAVTSDAVAEQVQATLSQRLTGPIAALGRTGCPSAPLSSRRSCSEWRCAATSCGSSRWPRCPPTTWWPPSARRCTST